MRITVPENLSKDIDKIDAICLEYDNTQNNSVNFINISKQHVLKLKFVNLFDHLYNDCTFVRYVCTYTDGSKKVFDFENKEAAKYVNLQDLAAQACLRTNLSSPYENSVEGRKSCLDEIDKLLERTISFSSAPFGTKNLVYYTVFFNTGYVDLFNLSVLSLLKHLKGDYDILVITDEATQQLINNTQASKLKDLKYFIVPTPEDGVEASKTKVHIYKYPELRNYSNVLFLDCDIVAFSDASAIFNLELKEDTLYTVKNKHLNIGHFKTIYHGFKYVSESFIEEMKLAEQMPFNAGQFMFKTSDKMVNHFKNVDWFMENWPSEYFFEQCFMCYYFCKGYLTDHNLLKPFIGINSTENNSATDPDIKQKPLIHFIAPPLDAKSKLKFISEFNTTETVVKKEGFFSKLIKKWTTK